MRLSEAKIEKLGRDLARMLENRRDLVAVTGPVRLEREIVRFLTADLAVEDEITQEALDRMRSYSREVPEGTTEWQVLLERHKMEIAARRGYVI